MDTILLPDDTRSRRGLFALGAAELTGPELYAVSDVYLPIWIAAGRNDSHAAARVAAEEYGC